MAKRYGPWTAATPESTLGDRFSVKGPHPGTRDAHPRSDQRIERLHADPDFVLSLKHNGVAFDP